jgi:DNA-binding NtrC family response regulator
MSSTGSFPLPAAPRATILFVDDDEHVRKALARSLQRCGDYRLLFVDGGRPALELMRKEPVDIVISDQSMPGMTGLELMKLVRDRNPEIIRIILTGHADADTVMEAVNQGEVYRFLTKPFDQRELQLTLKTACDRLEVERQNRRLLDAVRARPDVLAELAPDVARK